MLTRKLAEGNHCFQPYTSHSTVTGREHFSPLEVLDSRFWVGEGAHLPNQVPPLGVD
jgi:hypothetical protein